MVMLVSIRQVPAIHKNVPQRSMRGVGIGLQSPRGRSQVDIRYTRGVFFFSLKGQLGRPVACLLDTLGCSMSSVNQCAGKSWKRLLVGG